MRVLNHEWQILPPIFAIQVLLFPCCKKTKRKQSAFKMPATPTTQDGGGGAKVRVEEEAILQCCLVLVGRTRLTGDFEDVDTNTLRRYTLDAVDDVHGSTPKRLPAEHRGRDGDRCPNRLARDRVVEFIDVHVHPILLARLLRQTLQASHGWSGHRRDSERLPDVVRQSRRSQREARSICSKR